MFFSTVNPLPVVSSLSNSLDSTTILASLGNVTASNAARLRFQWPSVKDPKIPHTFHCITGLTTASQVWLLPWSVASQGHQRQVVNWCSCLGGSGQVPHQGGHFCSNVVALPQLWSSGSRHARGLFIPFCKYVDFFFIWWTIAQSWYSSRGRLAHEVAKQNAGS